MFNAIHCPQCGGTLPRQAIWRTVSCPYCKALITRDVETVRRADFHAAWQRAHGSCGSAGRILQVGERRYRLLALLGEGEHSAVHLAESCGASPARVTIKLARNPANSLLAEADVLRQLAALNCAGAEYFSQRLPQLEHVGLVGESISDAPATERLALVLRHPVGFGSSVADILGAHPRGLRDPRHAVWIWRRILEVLAYIHASGWTHGDLRPEHLLVHPGDHGVLMIGWAHAKAGGDTVRDLQQSAWVIRSLLAGESGDAPAIPISLPRPLANLLRRASQDSHECRRLGAVGIEQQLVAAAREAFGPPTFVHFDPLLA